jgi:hypothetical protein
MGAQHVNQKNLGLSGTQQESRAQVFAYKAKTALQDGSELPD